MKINQVLGSVAVLVAAGWIQVAHANQPETPVACAEGPPQTLVFGNHTTGCTIGDPLDQDNFTFNAVAGEVIRLNGAATGDNMDPSVLVRDPMGVVEASGGCSNACSFEINFAAAKTGTYLISVSDTGNNEAGEYELGLERIPPVAAAPLLPYDASTIDTIDHRADDDFFRFEGIAGSTVSVVVDGTADNMDPFVEVRDPLGATLFTSFCTNACSLSSGNLSLTVTGDYLVSLRDVNLDETGTYSVAVQCSFGPCFRQTRTRQYIDASGISYLSADDVAELHYSRISTVSSTSSEATLVFVMNTLTDAQQAKLYVFDDKWRPVGITTVDNNGTDVLSVLATVKASGFIKVRTMDVATNLPLATVLAFPSNWDAISIATLPDRNADGVEEIGVTARRTDNGVVVIRTIDPLTGVIFNDTPLPTP